MRPLTSSLLDLLRISAAVGVVLSHVATSSFSHRVPLLESLGHACVAVFFVLSGYVIAWVADTRETGARSYAIARLSRIYSVLIPALVVTVLLDYASYRLDPAFYGSIVGTSTTGPGNLIRAALFLNQTYGADYAPGTNSPVWSLGYEVPYYALFAVLLFARGIWRLGGIVLLLAVEGPAVWILFPVWLMGAGLYVAIGRRPPARLTIVLAVAGIVCLAAASPFLARLQTRLYRVEDDYADLIQFGHSNQFLIFYTIGLFVCLLIALVDGFDRMLGDRLSAIRKAIAYCAGSTFSIYLFHFPILVAIYCATHYDRANLSVVTAVFVSTIAACVVLSYVSERRKRIWTRMISTLIVPAKSPAPSSLFKPPQA